MSVLISLRARPAAQNEHGREQNSYTRGGTGTFHGDLLVFLGVLSWSPSHHAAQLSLRLRLDTDTGTASWQRAEYDIAGAQAAIRAARLPDSLAERLQYGQ